MGKVDPYGVYHVTAGTWWVSVGTDHGAFAFTVDAIRAGATPPAHAYPHASRLLITVDGGVSNGSLTPLRKTE